MSEFILKPSSISNIMLEGREFYVKRDDLIDPYLAGNKYRKLYTLLNTPKQVYKTIISYGGTQSNAMLAIAAMCKKKGWEFIYYTKPLSKYLKLQQEGNYFDALRLGMKHKEIDESLYKDFIASLRLTLDDSTYIIDQGGAVVEARQGIDVLAQEIREHSLDLKSLATPSGTGTTALFLAQALREFTIYTTPCIGDVEYLKTQMRAIGDIPKNLIFLEPQKKYHFAKPYKEFLEIYLKLFDAGVEFDLLYAPSIWQALLSQTKERILYIHSGGVSGNKTMLKRYAQKGFLKI